MGGRENVIILTKDGVAECWGSITEICRNHPELKYGYVKGLKFPFTYKGFEFKKVKFKTKLI